MHSAGSWAFGPESFRRSSSAGQSMAEAWGVTSLEGPRLKPQRLGEERLTPRVRGVEVGRAAICLPRPGPKASSGITDHRES
jgi:hypothetical protein